MRGGGGGVGDSTSFIMKVEKGAQAFPETIRGLSRNRYRFSSYMLWRKLGDGTIPITGFYKLIISKDFR